MVVDTGIGSVACSARTNDRAGHALALGHVRKSRPGRTVGQGGHPGLDRVWEAFDQCTQTQDGGVQGPEGLLVAWVTPRRQFRLPREGREPVLLISARCEYVRRVLCIFTYSERDDALSRRTSYYPGQHLRGHLPHLDVLVRETVEQHVHHPRYHVGRDAHEIAIEEDQQSGQCIQSHPPGLLKIAISGPKEQRS